VTRTVAGRDQQTGPIHLEMEGPIRGTANELGFRRLGRSDFSDVQRWLSMPHVREWWGDHSPDAEAVEDDFGPCVDGIDPTLVFVVTLSSQSIGIVQTYLLSDNPEYQEAVQVSEAAGIDLFIGEASMLGLGLGVRTVSRFVSDIGWNTFPEVDRYMAGPSVRNIRSRRTFERAGFVFVGEAEVPGEPDREAILVIERPPTSRLEPPRKSARAGETEPTGESEPTGPRHPPS